MLYSPENHAELNVLMLYKSSSSLEGIKIHKTAEPSLIAAAQRLFEAGFITQADGGYLTSPGSVAAEHAHLLYDMLHAHGEE
jgi:uncharacterized protein (TIGR02647 family)